MAYLADLLITESFYLSGIVSREFEQVTGQQMSDGLKLLNSLIAFKSSDLSSIPYFDLVTIPGVIGQERYFVPNLLAVESLTFNIGPIRYSMLEEDRTVYFGTPRVDNIQALPYSYHLERTLDGSYLYIYFTPAGAYPLNIMGKFGLLAVTQFQDLALTLDLYYIEYLRYALAQYICDFYKVSLAPSVLRKLEEYELKIRDLSPVDLVMEKLSTLQQDTSINYGDVNIGKGWRP
jgi:hypothetical protein